MSCRTASLKAILITLLWAIIYAMFGLASPAFGIAVAFVSAVIAVKWMVAYLNRHGLEVFGYYRIALGLTVAGLMLGGMLG